LDTAGEAKMPLGKKFSRPRELEVDAGEKYGAFRRPRATARPGSAELNPDSGLPAEREARPLLRKGAVARGRSPA